MSDDRTLVEIRRLLAESDKFVAEQRKLIAESQKLDKERWWFPWLQIITTIAALVAAFGVVFHR
jgi:hypothetical protein